jgi:CRP/FNR family transcriptional regulator, cyclic AMP receptor protein
MRKQAAPPGRSCLSCAVRGPHCFCNLSMEALQDLQDIGTSLRFGADEMIVREGFSADRVYVVCSGRVKLTASSPDGRLLILRIAGPGFK